MDIRISAPYTSLITALLSLKPLNSSKKNIAFINQCIEQIERVAIFRSKISYYYLELETEIERLDKVEAKFKETLYQIITYSEIIQIYPQLNASTSLLSSVSCFTALTIAGIILGVVLNTPVTPLAGILLCLALASTLIIFQANSSLISHPSPVLSHLQETCFSLMRDLKKHTVYLDKNISLLEDKVNFRENKGPDFMLSHEEEAFLTPPSSPTALYNVNHLFKTYAKNGNNLSTVTPTLQAYQPNLNLLPSNNKY